MVGLLNSVCVFLFLMCLCFLVDFVSCGCVVLFEIIFLDICEFEIHLLVALSKVLELLLIESLT